MKKFLILLFVQFYFVGNAFPIFTLFSLENLNNQLSNNSILCMYQDNYGFMWIGTYDGLNLYDGKDVTSFRFELGNPYSLSGNSIHRIIQADEEHLWVATNMGLDKFSMKTHKVVETYPAYEKIALISVNHNNETWLINKDNSISYYNNRQKKIYEIPIKEFNTNDIKLMFVDEKDQLCLISKEGEILFINLQQNGNSQSNPFSLTVKKKAFHNQLIENAFFENGKIYFIDKNHNLFVYDKKEQQKINLCNISNIINKYGTSISSLCFFNNNIFIGFLHGGLLRVDMNDRDKWEPINTSVGIFSLMRDHYQNSIWIATDGQGVELYYSEKNTFTNILLKQLPFTARRPIRSIYTDEYNTLWIGTKGDGIIKIKNYDKISNNLAETRKQIIWEREYLNCPVYCFRRSKYNKNDLWIGGDKFSYYSYKDDRIYNIGTANNEIDNLSEIHAICETSDTTLWVSSQGLWHIVLDKKTTPYKIKRKEQQFFLRDGNNTNDVFYSMLQNSDSTLILGSRKGYGAIQYNIRNKQYHYININNANNKGLGDIISMYAKGDSILYMGASTGLTQVQIHEGKENIVKQFGRKNGIVNDMIHGVLEDSDGIIWLSTSKGLVKYNPKNDSFFNVKSPSLKVVEFSDNAYWHCPITGRLFWGGVDGLTWIDPSKNTEHVDFEPDLLFTNLNLYGKDYNLYEYNNNNSKKLILQADQRTFQISFATLDYINGDSYDYFYKLENYNTEWIPLQKNNKIIFTQLPSGEYTLKVKYKNDVTNPEHKIYSLQITVLPPWYLSTIAYIIYTVLALLLIISTIFYMRKKLKRKQEIIAKKIKRQEQEKLYESKMRFFTNITHELFTPLTLINGAVEQIGTSSNNKQNIDKYISVLQSNASSLNDLLQEIIDYRRIEEGHEELYADLERISVTSFISNFIKSFSTAKIDNNIDLDIVIPENLYWYTNKNSFKKIISNLLSNAFKYTPQGGEIKVTISEEANLLKINIYNTGAGIEKDRIGLIFNRFQILEDVDVNINNQMTARNGLGLSICYSMTKYLKGELTVESELGKFTNFLVTLPRLVDEDKNITYTNPIVDKSDDKSTKKMISFNSPLLETDKAKARILIVDDNKEIVDLIEDIISSQFVVLKVYNAKEALKALQSETPALIITDIMMPEIDGLSFIQTLRKDKFNKHLPIIALSAKIEDIDIIKGYEAGTDAYITKPFSSQILLSIMHRLLDNSEQLRKYYNTTDSAFKYSSGKLMHTEDKEFIDSLSNIINNNITNTQLGPEFIAEKMNISSRNLYRQLKKILSVSTSDYIKDFRLSYSARLLLTTNLSIKEIIYKVGFTNTTYFYNEFSKKYNMSPKQFRDADK